MKVGQMFNSWNDLKPIFQTPDGDLPEIGLKKLFPKSVIISYEFIRDNSVWPTNITQSYWSITESRDVEFSKTDNPAKNVIDKNADPFHICFDSTVSPSGFKVPSLGVYIFQDSISLDYRAGHDWKEEALKGLFEIINYVYSISDTMCLKHSGNIYDESGKILESAWNSYKNANSK